MSFKVKKLFLSPVKSMSFSSSAKLYIQKDIGIMYDRIFALTRKISKKKSIIIEKNPEERNLNYFLTLRNSPFLNKYNFELKNNLLIFKLNNEIITSINSNDEICYDVVVRELIKRENSIEETYLIRNDKFPFFDTTPDNSLSLINLNSIKDFESKIKQPVEYSRFRGNIYVNNLSPWKEFDYIGKHLMINNCRFEVINRISRCSATNLLPNSTEININLPQKLKQTYNHTDMGIYLLPLNEGVINVNDKVYIE